MDNQVSTQTETVFDMAWLAKVGYEGYCAASDGKAYDGTPLKTWDELDDARRAYWTASANAIHNALYTVPSHFKVEEPSEKQAQATEQAVQEASQTTENGPASSEAAAA